MATRQSATPMMWTVDPIRAQRQGKSRNDVHTGERDAGEKTAMPESVSCSSRRIGSEHRGR